MIVKSSLSQLRYHILVDGLKMPKDSEDVSSSSFINNYVHLFIFYLLNFYYI
jgi:hypothetical protein